MAYAVKKRAFIKETNKLGADIYEMFLEQEDIAENAKAGQFISIYLKDKTKLLPRPISICETDRNKKTIRIVYRIAGEGTAQLSEYKKGEYVDIMGPLGNGFKLEGFNEAVLIGGGIGIPPMLETAKQLKCNKTVVLGYRDSFTFLADEFRKYANVVIATEDGSVGIKGNVIDAVKAQKIKADMILACGPTPMLQGIKSYAETAKIKAQVSMEERMACGIGACLACVCKSKEKDSHTNVNNKRICKDGPVFFTDEI